FRQWDCLDVDSQRFRLDMDPDGASYSISQGNYWCVDVTGSSTTAPTDLSVLPCDGLQNQRWTSSIKDYFINVLSPKHASGSCLATAGGSTAGGARLVQSSFSRAASQFWRINRVDGDGGAMIRSQSSDLCVSPSGSAAVQHSCDGGWQTWNLF